MSLVGEKLLILFMLVSVMFPFPAQAQTIGREAGPEADQNQREVPPILFRPGSHQNELIDEPIQNGFAPPIIPEREKFSKVRKFNRIEDIFSSFPDSVLSSACSAGYFNQRQVRRRVVKIKDARGYPLIYGYVRHNDGNLEDRLGYSQPQTVYLFQGDGTSQCKVLMFFGGS